MTESHGGEGSAVEAITATFPGTEELISLYARTSHPLSPRRDQALARAQMLGCEAGCGSDAYLPPVPRYFVVIPDTTPATFRIMERLFKKARVGMGNVAWVKMGACDECRGNVLDVFWAANTDYVLLLGAAAKNLWRKDLTMPQTVGRVGIMWDRYVVKVLPNPDELNHVNDRSLWVDRWVLGLKAWEESVKQDRGVVLGGREGGWVALLPVTAEMGSDCVELECGVTKGLTLDRDALGWCGDHINDGWMKARGVKIVDANQGVLFQDEATEQKPSKGTSQVVFITNLGT